MFLTIEIEYGMRVFRALAHGGQRSIKKIAIEENIPINFAYKIVDKLTQAKLLQSEIGRAGGVRILRPLDELSLYDIINVIDPRRCLFKCVKWDNDCKLNTAVRPCLIHQELKRLQDVLECELKRKSMKDIFIQ